MTTQTTTRGPQQRKEGVRLQVAMTALTLTLLAGFLLWQAWPGGGQTTTPAAVSTTQDSATQAGTTQSSRTEGATPRGGMAELYADQAAQAGTATRKVYIVESQERVATLRASLDQIDANRVAQGQPPLNQQVVAFDSSEEAARFMAAAERLRSTSDSPPMTVVDLRGQTADPCLALGGVAADIRDAC